MKFHTNIQCGKIQVGTLVTLLITLLVSSEALAVAGFARQTGMSCNQCHTSHGGATPNFTFTGKKFNGLGYRTPQVQVSDYEKGKPEDKGEYLLLKPPQLSGRFQWQALSAVKPPAGPNAGKFGEAITNPTSRFALFPFVGPIGANFGIWTEIYLLPVGSGNSDWTIVHGSYEEHDFRYIINPDDDDVYSISLSNQPIDGLFGFGPWPAVGLNSEISNRGGIGGYLHPNFATVSALGWMHDRWVWALGANTGDTNMGWDRSNLIGLFGYAFKNSNANELWANIYFRTGNDALPLVTRNTVPTNEHEFFFSDSVRGVGGTRPALCPSTGKILSGCPYLAEDMDDFTSVETEVRWAQQDRGPWSFEIVGRLGFNSENYNDGAKTTFDTWGIATQFGWKHTYYIKPYINGRLDYEFTDLNGVKYDIDTSLTYGFWLAYKPVENFLLAFEYHNLQSWSLTAPAGDDGARYSITADISF